MPAEAAVVLYVPIFFAEADKKGFPLQSLTLINFIALIKFIVELYVLVHVVTSKKQTLLFVKKLFMFKPISLLKPDRFNLFISIPEK